MEILSQNNLKEVLEARLALIHSIQVAFKRREDSLPKRFRRGAIQRELCREVGIHFIGNNKRLVNEALAGLGYIQIVIDGIRFYRKG